MRIHEVEQATGIAKKNIRFYEQQGLLSPPRNLENGYRNYAAKDVEALHRIKLLRRLGIPIEEIKKVINRQLSLEDCMRRHLAVLDREQKNLDTVRAFCARIAMDCAADDSSFDGLPALELLKDMESMEEGGTRWMDNQKKDRQLMKKAAKRSASIAIAVLLLPVALIVWLADIAPIPLPVALFLAAVHFAVIAGILLALKERIKEIEGGELDEAAKY